jgi:hypothetical protein
MVVAGAPETEWETELGSGAMMLVSDSRLAGQIGFGQRILTDSSSSPSYPQKPYLRRAVTSGTRSEIGDFYPTDEVPF